MWWREELHAAHPLIFVCLCQVSKELKLLTIPSLLMLEVAPLSRKSDSTITKVRLLVS